MIVQLHQLIVYSTSGNIEADLVVHPGCVESYVDGVGGGVVVGAEAGLLLRIPLQSQLPST